MTALTYIDSVVWVLCALALAFMILDVLGPDAFLAFLTGFAAFVAGISAIVWWVT